MHPKRICSLSSNTFKMRILFHFSTCHESNRMHTKECIGLSMHSRVIFRKRKALGIK
eukprot:c36828_g1_i1 orf=73-243(+)